MFIRQILNKTKEISKKYWYNSIFLVITIYLCLYILKLYDYNAHVIFFLSCFLISSFIERFSSFSKGIKFLLVSISFFFMMVPLFFYQLEFFTFVRLLVMIEAYFIFLYQNSLGALIVYLITEIRVLMYSPYVERPAIIGNTMGMTVFAITFTMMSVLLRKLIHERNKFKLLSIRDSLTGAYTLAHIIDIGNQYLKEGLDVTVMLLDMNNFKQVNDTYGHIIGNKVLLQVSNFLENKLDDDNVFIGRIGGDEFIILFRDVPLSQIEKISESLYIEINDIFFELDPDISPIQLSFAMGRSSSKSILSRVDVDKLVQNAAIDRYLNKYGKNRMDNNIRSFRNLFPDQINRFLNVLAEKDMYTFIHSEYTAQYAASLARKLGLSENIVKDIYRAGWLHDIGKIFISNNILRKIGKLTVNEYDTIKQHVNFGVHTIQSFNLSDTIFNGILYHHESWNGSGYLKGLKGKNIPLEARILKIADSYSAMIIKRVYRVPMTKQVALNEIKRKKGIEFDPELVELFEEMLSKDSKNFISDTINKWMNVSNLSFNNPEIIISDIS